MRLAPYPKSKLSGIEWMGNVPEHWPIMRLRFVVRLNPRCDRLRSLFPGDEVSFVPMDAVGEYGSIRLESSKPIGEIGGSYTEFEDDDIVIAKITPCFENGKGAIASGLSNGCALGTTELHVLRAGPQVRKEFLFYVTISSVFRKLGEAEMYGAGGQKRVPPSFVEDFPSGIPSIDEQVAIASFLDRETERIDELIAKQRDLIDLLGEKRRTLISRCVTRGLPPAAAKAAGLNPRPKLKPTSIDWLGEIPEHWVVNRMSRVCISIRDGTHNPPDRAAGIHRLLSVRNIQEGRFTLLEDDRTMTEEDFAILQRSYTVDEGDIVLAIVGATTGKSAIVGKLDNVTVQRSLAILRPNRNMILSSFLHYVIQSPLVQTEIGLTVFKYSAQPGIYLGDVSKLPVVLPDLGEQTAIASYLNAKTATLDRLTSKAEVMIDRLQEYRTTLITAAVTGKIDVRKELADD